MDKGKDICNFFECAADQLDVKPGAAEPRRHIYDDGGYAADGFVVDEGSYHEANADKENGGRDKHEDG